MHLKLFHKKAIQKTAGATGDLVGHKIANKITNVARSSLQNNKEMIKNDKEMSNEKYILPEEKEEIIDDL